MINAFVAASALASASAMANNLEQKLWKLLGGKLQRTDILFDACIHVAAVWVNGIKTLIKMELATTETKVTHATAKYDNMVEN